MGRHSKLKQRRNQKYTYSNEVPRASVEDDITCDLELKEMGWSDGQIDSIRNMRVKCRRRDKEQRQRNNNLAKWTESGKSFAAIGLPFLDRSPYSGRIMRHTKTLLKLSLPLDPLNPDSAAFLSESLPVVKQIGQELYVIGGHGLMVKIGELIPKPFGRELDYAWDGIGDWRC